MDSENDKLEQISFSKEEIAKLNRRDCYEKTANNIKKSHGTSGRIICLHGLRRTGKTTLMKQLSLEFGGNIFQVKENQTMENILETVKAERDKGEKIVFIDEVTFAKDFISNSALLADLYAGDGIDIVVAGTDSLGLQLAKNEQLFDRTHDVEMTYISFAEHSRVLNTADFDEYIKFGGLMTKGLDDNEGVVDIETANTYLNSAVAGNISRTLSKTPSYPGFIELKRHSTEDMQKSIKKIMELYNGSMDEFLLNSNIKTMIGSPISDYLKKKEVLDSDKNIFKKIDRAALNVEYKEKINILEDLERPANEKFVEELTEILFKLDLLTAIGTRKFSNVNDVWETYSSREYYIIQPAIKYWLYTEAKEVYLTGNETANLDDKHKEMLANQLQSDIFGRVTETTVIFQSAKSLGDDFLVVRPYFEKNSNPIGEYDMLVWDKKNNCHWAFEIKHTTEPFLGDDENKMNGQDKHLLNKEFTALMTEKYGERKANVVLYNGSPFISPKGTAFLNVASYLKTLDKERDMERTIGEITASISPKREIIKKTTKQKSRNSGWEW